MPHDDSAGDPPFGVQLRRLRLERGVSLTELARRAFFSKGHLSKIENGRSAPGLDVARQCDAALGADGTLIAAYARASADRRTPAPAGEDAGPEDPPPVRPDGEPQRDEDWVLGMDERGSVWFQPFGRRQALVAGAASLLALSAEPSRPRHGRDGSAVLATFTAMFADVRRLGQQVAPAVLLPTLIAQTQTLRGLASDTGGADRRALRRLASRYAEYIGWMAQEAGQERAALWWTDTAARYAASAGDAELAAYGLVRRGLVTLYAGDAAQTVALSQRAAAHPAAGERVRGLAAQREAQGHALAGDRLACERALERAESLLSTAPPGLGSATMANPVALTRAWCLHDLGDVGGSARAFDELLPSVPATARRFRARWSARRALALASAGELDRACALTPAIAADQATIDSATVRLDVAALARVLARHATHRPARDAHASLAAALHHGVA